MTKRQKTQVEISRLEYLALKYAEGDTTDDEIRKENITDDVYYEINKMHESKEVINIAVTGQTTSGKSICMEKLVWDINKDLLNKEMGLDKICADQYEFGRKTLDNYTNICFGVDEFSALETTGWNATVETKYLEQFSDVQAQRYIHRISCSPTTVADKNCQIILRIISKNMETKINTALVYYRLFSPRGDMIQLIGHMNIYVGDVLEREWHERYRKRKMRKMELVYAEGIFRMRDIHFAEVVLDSYKSLQLFTPVMRPNKDVIEGKIKRQLQEKKIPITSLAIEHIKSETASLLSQKIAIETFKRAIKSKNKSTSDKEILNKGCKEATEDLQKDIDRYKRLVAINKEYERI